MHTDAPNAAGYIRTVVPFLWANLIAQINATQDVVEIVPTAKAEELVVGAVFVAWYAAARWIERRAPWAGRLMLGSAKTPTYSTNPEA